MASWKTHQLNGHINGKLIELKGSSFQLAMFDYVRVNPNPIAIVSGRSNEEKSKNGRAWRLTHL